MPSQRKNSKLQAAGKFPPKVENYPISTQSNDLDAGASVQRVVLPSRARECSFGNPSRTSQVLVSEVFGASATIDDHCTTARERTATAQPTECQRISV